MLPLFWHGITGSGGACPGHSASQTEHCCTTGRGSRAAGLARLPPSGQRRHPSTQASITGSWFPSYTLASGRAMAFGEGAGVSRARRRRMSLPDDAAGAAQAMGTTNRLTSLEAKAPEASSSGEAGSVRALIAASEARKLHTTQLRMALAADDERERLLGQVDRGRAEQEAAARAATKKERTRLLSSVPGEPCAAHVVAPARGLARLRTLGTRCVATERCACLPTCAVSPPCPRPQCPPWETNGLTCSRSATARRPAGTWSCSLTPCGRPFS